MIINKNKIIKFENLIFQLRFAKCNHLCNGNSLAYQKSLFVRLTSKEIPDHVVSALLK
jgi:hypothetical protein